ncbi:MAG: Lrp/AsnC family transcriptional regulator [Flavobacteriaceae bacterium]|nr:Lrp/AsnC family transcriptional regulator [Flavobacteriaceae bacterium]
MFDSTDIKLLGLLQEDSKQTTKALANKLGLSTTAVYERIKRLERSGVIRKYVALLDKEKISRNFTAFCRVKLTQHVKPFVLQFEKQVMQLQEVSECHHISGDHDYLLKIHVYDMKEFREFIVGKLTALDNIGSTQSSFVINEVKYTTAIDLNTKN